LYSAEYLLGRRIYSLECFLRRNNLKNIPGVEAESLRGFTVGESDLLDVEKNYMIKTK
jgi:hypothetical protein